MASSSSFFDSCLLDRRSCPPCSRRSNSVLFRFDLRTMLYNSGLEFGITESEGIVSCYCWNTVNSTISSSTVAGGFPSNSKTSQGFQQFLIRFVTEIEFGSQTHERLVRGLFLRRKCCWDCIPPLVLFCTKSERARVVLFPINFSLVLRNPFMILHKVRRFTAKPRPTKPDDMI